MSSESLDGTQGARPDPCTDALAEALSIIRDASERRIPVRLVGGLAVRLLCQDFPARQAEAQDLDLASVSSASRALSTFLEEQGYLPDQTFNALYGRKQLFFAHDENGRALDVMIDQLEMCHTVEFKDRIESMPYTLSLLDLLLSKLQIVELNEKDAQDVLYLLSAYSVAESDEPSVIDLRVFRQILGNDWGWWRTVTMNLERIETLADGERSRLVPAQARLDPREQLRRLQQAADEAPKSLRWKMRARVGDRVRWYRTPEETVHD